MTFPRNNDRLVTNRRQSETCARKGEIRKYRKNGRHKLVKQGPLNRRDPQIQIHCHRRVMTPTAPDAVSTALGIISFAFKHLVTVATETAYPHVNYSLHTTTVECENTSDSL